MSLTSRNKLTRATVSVIIPFFNREDFLAEAIESVLAQTFQDWELILVDDGSSDRSRDVAQSFVEKFPRKISLYDHENGANRGASSSRNLGIKYATGSFITFLDSDDLFLPDTLKIEIGALERHREADVVCGTLEYWFSWTTQQGKRERDFFVNLGLPTERLYEPPSLFVHNLRAGGRKPGIGCVILRSDFARSFEMFEDNFISVCEDQVFWARVCLHARIFVLKDCLAKYRQHPHSSTSALMNGGDLNADWRQFSSWLENYLARHKIEDQELWQAIKVFQKENVYRLRHQRLLRLYHRMLSYQTRYRIRDLIIKWRTQT